MRAPGPRIGLLGGSFNPAHDGHRALSLMALKRLGLRQVWWLVSPQNPLKPTAGMAPLDQRLAWARQIARHPRIKVSAIEARLGTRYSADTVARLKAMFPRCRFVWLMGADNLGQLHHWRRWRRLVGQVPIAVFGRAPYSGRAMAGPAASGLRHRRVPSARAKGLAGRLPPAWSFLWELRHPASATAIRARAQGPNRGDPDDNDP